MKDVIIILAGGINIDGSLPEIPKLRVIKGVELLKEGVAPNLIMSGRWGFWAENEFIKTEAQAMKEYAISLGAPENVIYNEDKSSDTVGNAYFCRIELLDPKNWKQVSVVTSEYHIPRAQVIFEKVLGPGFNLDFVPVDSKLSSEQLEKQITKEQKTIGVLNDWIKDIEPGNLEKIHHLMYTKHPGYAKNPEVTKEQLLKLLDRK